VVVEAQLTISVEVAVAVRVGIAQVLEHLVAVRLLNHHYFLTLEPLTRLLLEVAVLVQQMQQ
jgi:hypothetical protein